MATNPNNPNNVNNNVCERDEEGERMRAVASTISSSSMATSNSTATHRKVQVVTSQHDMTAASSGVFHNRPETRKQRIIEALRSRGAAITFVTDARPSLDDALTVHDAGLVRFLQCAWPLWVARYSALGVSPDLGMSFAQITQHQTNRQSPIANRQSPMHGTSHHATSICCRCQVRWYVVGSLV
jgi:hypothetical protein